MKNILLVSKFFLGTTTLFLCLKSLALPTAGQLQHSGKMYLQDKSFSTGDFFDFLQLKTALPKKFYHVDQFQDYALGTGEPVARIVGIYEIKRDDRKVVPFALFFDEQGQPLSLHGTFEKSDEACLPYFFHELGTLAIRYTAQSKDSDLWALRGEMMKALEAMLNQSALSSQTESLSVTLRPNASRTEPQQTIQILNAKKLYENEIAEAAKKLSVPGITHIDGGVARSGNPVNGFFGPGGATCTEIK